MFRLSSDESFHFEILRSLSHARYYGADINEVLGVASRIEAGKFESFSNEFNRLADRVYAQANEINSQKYPVSARDAYFRASTYFRAADFYLHGNPDDPRIMDLWEKQTEAFDKALKLLPNPGERVTLKGSGFDIPGIFYPASNDSHAKATIIMGTGYDGAQEELMHDSGFAALERGYNVMTYEGPGQPSVRRYQNLGFITDWEKVVTPVVDYLYTRSDVDTTRIGLMGNSMGGWLALRAAAFEHRIACVIANDGVYDLGEAYTKSMPHGMQHLLDSGDHTKMDQAIREALKNPKAPAQMRWGIEQGVWSFNVDSPSAFMKKTKPMTLEGLENNITCPVWVGWAEHDQFFEGQPQQVKKALGDKAVLVKFTKEDSADHHCHVGATVLLAQRIFDWFEEVTSKAV